MLGTPVASSTTAPAQIVIAINRFCLIMFARTSLSRLRSFSRVVTPKKTEHFDGPCSARPQRIQFLPPKRGALLTTPPLDHTTTEVILSAAKNLSICTSVRHPSANRSNLRLPFGGRVGLVAQSFNLGSPHQSNPQHKQGFSPGPPSNDGHQCRRRRLPNPPNSQGMLRIIRD